MVKKDLDSSLDDIIKNKNIRGRKQNNKQTRGVPRAPKAPKTKGINSRLGDRIPPKRNEAVIKRGPIITRASNFLSTTKINPASLLITKTINGKKNLPAKKLPVKKLPVTVLNPVYHPKEPNTKTHIVLLCNLDPRATAEDVGETCSMFGPIISCDMLLDPMGRALHEAEVEFVYPHSAEECVSKLDGEIADGRVLRARLQIRATPPVVPRYSSKTVGVSSRIEQPIRYMPTYQTF